MRIMKIVAVGIFLAAFATVTLAQTVPTRTPNAGAGQSMPERDFALDWLKFSWTPFALAVAKDERSLPRLRSSIIRLIDPVEEFGPARLEFVNEEFLARGVALLIQISNTGQVFNWEWLEYPYGVNQHRRIELPILDPGQGSGQVRFLYFVEGQNPAGQLGLLVNYPLAGSQPENPAVQVLRRTLLVAEAGNYGQAGYEFEVEAEDGLISAFVDGRPVGIIASQLPFEGSKKQVFLLPLTALYGLHSVTPGRTVELTFCTVAGQCISETLTPRIRAFTTPMDQ